MPFLIFFFSFLAQASWAATPSTCDFSLRPWEKWEFRFAKKVLSGRYSVRLKNLDSILEGGNSQVLFVVNHPTQIVGPALLTVHLAESFRASPLMDESLAPKFSLNRFFTSFSKPFYLPSFFEGKRRDVQVRRMEVVSSLLDHLKGGKNAIVWPAGNISRDGKEGIPRHFKILSRIMEAAPDTRLVLVRSTGLWGSSFSTAQGKPRDLSFSDLWLFLKSGVKNRGFPKREVQFEFYEPDLLPPSDELNSFVMDWMNSVEQPLIEIPLVR